MKLSIIIINYNVKYFLEQCLFSLRSAITEIDAEIFVVDNNSTDGSLPYLQNEFKDVFFIANKENKGFAKANNQALNLAKGDYILFLNPDTILPEDGLINCIKFFESNAYAGAAGVRMIDGSGKFLPESKRSFPSPLTSFFKLVGLSALFPTSKLFGKYAMGYLDENKVYEVDVLAGAFMMIKKQVLKTTGGFDESFFMYGEDIDLSYRIQEQGYKNYYLGNTTIIHFKGESTKKGTLNYVRMFYSAMRLFVKKHYRGAGAWIMYAGLQIAIILRAFISAVAAPFILFVHLFHRKIISKNPKEIILIGDGISVIKAQKIMQIHLTKTIFQIISSYQKINLQNLKADEIIFCIGELSYYHAIKMLQQIPGNISAKWFHPKSKSIVGSSYKNRKGKIYTHNDDKIFNSL